MDIYGRIPYYLTMRILMQNGGTFRRMKSVRIIQLHVCSMYGGLEEDTQGIKISENAALIDRNKILLYEESTNKEVELSWFGL